MRSFFKSELETLKIKRGLNQWENLSSMTNAEGENIGEQSIKMFLDLQEEVCQEFKYIPDNDKKRIIQYGILHEPEFMQWTPHHTWKWLNQKAGLYFKQDSHTPGICPTCGKAKDDNGFCSNAFHMTSNAKAVTYEELTPSTREAFDVFLRGLQSDNAGFKPVPTVTQKEIDDLKQEDLEEREGQHGIKYPSTKPEYVSQFRKKIEWAQLHTDLQTGRVKEGSPSFEEWQNGAN